MKTNKQITGSTGEQIALDYLEREGFVILEKNWRYRRSEIDLIAREGELLVFVEVKTRNDDTLGQPEQMISKRKLAIMMDAVWAYMEQINHDQAIRIDFIGILLKSDESYAINHIRDAYWPE